LGADPVKGFRNERGNHLVGPSPLPSQGCGREDLSPVDADGVGRRVRSSPRPGKPVTWRRDPVCSHHQCRPRSPLVNTGDPWPDLFEAEYRVLVMQTKLHQWAMADPGRCFDDVFNLVYDPAFLVVAWRRVRGNRGARSAGVDGVVPARSASVQRSCWEGCETISRPAPSHRCLCGNG